MSCLYAIIVKIKIKLIYYILIYDILGPTQWNLLYVHRQQLNFIPPGHFDYKDQIML